MWSNLAGLRLCISSTGMVYDEDAIKKSKTNATVKALSLLGFAGDIHAGYWNAHGYQQRAYEYFYGPINNAANNNWLSSKPRTSNSHQ